MAESRVEAATEPDQEPADAEVVGAKADDGVADRDFSPTIRAAGAAEPEAVGARDGIGPAGEVGGAALRDTERPGGGAEGSGGTIGAAGAAEDAIAAEPGAPGAESAGWVPTVLPPPTSGTAGPVDRDTGAEESAEAEPDAAGDADEPVAGADRSRHSRIGFVPAWLAIAILVALFGFGLAVQVHSNTSTSGLPAARQEDLVRILDDLSSRQERLRSQIAALEATRAKLATTGDNTSVALEEARTRSAALAILAGTAPAQGPGIAVTMTDPAGKLGAEDLLDAIEELRAAGAEAIQLDTVRIGLDSAFTAADDGTLMADRHPLSRPYQLLAIGEPGTLGTALNIPGGVVDTARNARGQVTIVQQHVLISAVRPLTAYHVAQPAGGN